MVRRSPSYECVQNFDVSAGSALTGHNKCKAQQVEGLPKSSGKQTESHCYNPLKTFPAINIRKNT